MSTDSHSRRITMTRRPIGITIVAVALAGGEALAAPPAPTVRVDCDRGGSINAALGRLPDSETLTVEISGVCRENVVVTRDRVVLRGGDPSRDGIQAVGNAVWTDFPLWLRGAEWVSVENLQISGGFHGMVVTNAKMRSARLVNSRIQGNVSQGLMLENAWLIAEDVSFELNGYDVGAWNASQIDCDRCTLGSVSTTTSWSVLAGSSSTVVLRESSLAHGVLAMHALVTMTDSSVMGRPGIAAVRAVDHSSVTLTRTPVVGSLLVERGSNLILQRVVQTSRDGPNLASGDSYILIEDAGDPASRTGLSGSTVLGLVLKAFSRANLLGTSTINGSLSCIQGANASCDNPANVTEGSSCGLCQMQ
jgi:hypothetical protein